MTQIYMNILGLKLGFGITSIQAYEPFRYFDNFKFTSVSETESKIEIMALFKSHA